MFYGKLTPNTKHPTPIYIGKAISIKDRVKNHFMQPSYRDNLFINKVLKIDFIETNSEIEALVLEANLIKKNQPKFNVIWKDDKNYFYVAIAQNKQRIPYVYITHQPKLSNFPLTNSYELVSGKKIQTTHYKLQTDYIGPFVEGAALKKILKYLRRVFPFYTLTAHPKNKCAWCHLKLCPGPTPDLAEYKKNIKKLILILEGKRKNVLYDLKKEMQTFSNSQEFENATKVKEKIRALEAVMSHSKVIAMSDIAITDGWQKTWRKLQEVLKFNKPISKIECYDISNIQGKFAVGSMVVFVDGTPDKSQYKKFRIRIADPSDPNIRMTSESTNNRKRNYELLESKPNDIAMLEQVLMRRIAHPEWKYPEVMLIDGGIAQLNIAIKTKNSARVFSKALANTREPKNIKIISIAKGRRELFIEEQKQPIPLKNLPQEIYNLVKHLDDEAHRFAITYHKELRKREFLK